MKKWTEHGNLTIEFAITLFGFLLVFFGLFDAALSLYRISALHQALGRTARQATIGLGLSTTDRVATLRQFLILEAKELGLSIQPSDVVFCALSDIHCLVPSAGSGSDFFKIRARITPSLFVFRPLSISAEVIMKNESFT